MSTRWSIPVVRLHWSMLCVSTWRRTSGYQVTVRYCCLSISVAVLIVSSAILGAVACRAGEAPSSLAATAGTPPSPLLRRLTRIEYANSLRDLFGLEFPFTADLPADSQVGGFTNVGEALSLPPVLLESYLTVARKVSEMVMGLGDSSPVITQFSATGDQSEWQEGMPIGTRGGAVAKYYFPRTGGYELRAFLDEQTVSGDGTLNHIVSEPTEGVRFFHTRARVPAGLHTFIVTFPDDYTEREGSVPNLAGPGGPGPGGPVDISASAIKQSVEFWLDGKLFKTLEINGPNASESFETQSGPPTLLRAEISGPFNPATMAVTAARRRLLVCAPKTPLDEKTCATTILRPVARLAYRREVAPADMALILAAVERKRAAGFDEAIAMGLRTILMSPDFLFRTEVDPPGVKPGQIYRISDYELATRLAHFLWSSLPDDELLDLAKHGRLRDRATLGRQTYRMLADWRADALVDNFAFQWLGLRELDSFKPDPKTYPDFDAGLARVIKQETRLFLRYVFREDRSILDVVSSDYTFLNDRLARLYGIPGVNGPAFRKVDLEGNAQRGGIIGQASVLMVSSHAATTSPVLRGKWVLTNLLDSPPPHPPPGVPPLNTKPASVGHILTMREQLERHRISPVCVPCHARMDPYGFALENYDVIGRWRNQDHGNRIDASAVLPHGDSFSGSVGLKQTLLAHANDFATATISRLMTYALGRQVGRTDQPAIRQIAEDTGPKRYRFKDIVLGIVESGPFLMRQACPVALAEGK